MCIRDRGNLPDTITSPKPAHIVPAIEDVQALADAINNARKVTLFVGAGARGAHDAVIELAELAKAPVGHSLRGKEVIQWDNPYDVGMSGLLGYGACQDAMEDADLLILVGTDFPYQQFLPANVRTAQIEIDAARAWVAALAWILPCTVTSAKPLSCSTRWSRTRPIGVSWTIC